MLPFLLPVSRSPERPGRPPTTAISGLQAVRRIIPVPSGVDMMTTAVCPPLHTAFRKHSGALSWTVFTPVLKSVLFHSRIPLFLFPYAKTAIFLQMKMAVLIRILNFLPTAHSRTKRVRSMTICLHRIPMPLQRRLFTPSCSNSLTQKNHSLLMIA